MLTSSRNKFNGNVASLKRGVVNDEIVIALPCGLELTAVITSSSTERLGIEVGTEATALIKASWVILAADLEGVRLSARNQFAGTVKEIKAGAVNSEVTVDVGGCIEIVAIITTESAHSLGLQKDSPVTALIKASHVLVGVEA